MVLYFVAQRFKVEEDPRIDDVEKMLPGANCGGCGYAGCRAMAEAMVKLDDLTTLYCPVGGADTMRQAAGYLGKAAPEKGPMVATMRCGGTCAKRPKVNQYDGAKSCAVVNTLYVGETACLNSLNSLNSLKKDVRRWTLVQGDSIPPSHSPPKLGGSG